MCCLLMSLGASSSHSWLFPLKVKSEVFPIFVNFKSYVENMIGNKIKILRFDLGG